MRCTDTGARLLSEIRMYSIRDDSTVDRREEVIRAQLRAHRLAAGRYGHVGWELEHVDRVHMKTIATDHRRWQVAGRNLRR
jgi:hypothetical protein